MGVILSTMGDVQYHGGYHDACGGYHEYCGGVQYCGGYHPLKFQYHGGYHDHVGDIMSTVGVFSTMGYSNNKRLFPHGTEHPPRYS